MGRGKSDFFTMEPPLEPAVQEGPSDPPKLTFGAKMESRGPHGTQKACQNDPQGTPETQKYSKKLQKTMKKDPTNTSKSYLYNNVKNISNEPKNETAETVQIIKTIKTHRKPISKKTNNAKSPNKSRKQYKQSRLPKHSENKSKQSKRDLPNSPNLGPNQHR